MVSDSVTLEVLWRAFGVDDSRDLNLTKFYFAYKLGNALKILNPDSMVSTYHTSEPVLVSTSAARGLKPGAYRKVTHCEQHVCAGQYRKEGGHVFITAVTAVTLARHIPTKDSPIYTGPSRLRGIKASQIEGPKKRERREALTVEWGSRRYSSFNTSI